MRQQRVRWSRRGGLAPRVGRRWAVWASPRVLLVGVLAFVLSPIGPVAPADASASADLAVTITGPASAAAGDIVLYTVKMTNNGPSAVPDATATVTLPGFTCVSVTAGACRGPSLAQLGPLALLAGDSALFSVTAAIDPRAGGAYNVTANVGSNTISDPNQTNNTATVQTTVGGSPVADLAITKTGPATATPASPLSYSLTVTNNGPNTAATVVVTDPLPPGVVFVSVTAPTGFTCTTPLAGSTGTVQCTTPSMASGASATLALQAYATATVGSSVSNTATVASATADPNLANNTSATVATTLQCAHSLTGQQPSMMLGSGSWCISGATFSGSVAIGPGATVVMVSSTVNGNLAAKNETGLVVCGTTVTGTLASSGATGFVLIGDPADDACAGNRVGVDAAFNSNTGGVEIGSNGIGRTLTLQNNGGSGPFADDTAIEVEANTISGNIGCVRNGSLTDDGQPNTVAGGRYGQCSALGF